MTPRQRTLLFGAAALLSLCLLRRAVEPPSRPAPPSAAVPAARAVPSTPVSPTESVPVRANPPTPTRAEAAAVVRALYRREQLTRELDFEQQRYAANYWQPDRSARAIATLQAAKAAMLQQLAAEANQVLEERFPGEAGEPLVLPAIFDADHPGPNITALSPASRAHFEAEILASGADSAASATRLLELADRLLSSAESENYHRWNEPAAAALRNELVGFDATETEFAALLQATREPEDDHALEARLGAARFASWRAAQEPALRTALQDLHRHELPLDDAAWLAATRGQATAAIRDTWQEPGLVLEVKARQVAALERTYGQAIAARFALPEGSLDELGLAP